MLICEQYALEEDWRLVVGSDLSSLNKLGGELYWYSDSLRIDERQYELEEYDVFSLDVLSNTVDGERLLYNVLGEGKVR